MLPHQLLDMCCLPTPYLLGVLSGSLADLDDLPLDEVSLISAHFATVKMGDGNRIFNLIWFDFRLFRHGTHNSQRTDLGTGDCAIKYEIKGCVRILIAKLSYKNKQKQRLIYNARESSLAVGIVDMFSRGAYHSQKSVRDFCDFKNHMNFVSIFV